jgi:hypothetical protein
MRVAIDPVKFMELLREGLTPNAIFLGRRPDGIRVRGISTQAAFRAYCAANPEWGREAAELANKNAVVARKHKGDLNRFKTHCKQGHSFADAYIYVAPEGGVMRHCRACQKMLLNKATPLPPAKLEQVKTLLLAKKSISEILGKRGTCTRVIAKDAFYAGRRADPAFDLFVRQHMPANRSHALKLSWSVKRVRQATAERREETNDYHRIAALVPSHLPPDIRDDIVQSIFLALHEGTLQRDQLKVLVREFIKAHYREANRHGIGKYGLVSLDAPIRADSDLRLIDRITQNNWDGVPA